MKNQSAERQTEKIFSINDFGKFLSRNFTFILVGILTFFAAVGVVYFDSTTTDTIASFALDEYEVGQISDKTIIAPKSIAADENFPINIEKGEKVIRKGFPITEEEFSKLEKMSKSPAYIDYRSFADSVLFLLLVAVLWAVLFNKRLLGKKIELKELVLESILFVVVFAVSALSGKALMFQSDFRLAVVIPAGLAAFLISILFGQVSALFFAVVMSLGVLCAAKFSLIPALFTFASMLSASRIVRSIERRMDMVFASLLLALLNIVFMLILKVIFNGNFNDLIFVLPGVGLNGFISGIFVLGLLTPLESAMNTASVFRLMDLSDQNSPIMRKLLLSASGTHQHSIMVAQLAESACKEIGANALLARVGAYFHDIGKMDHPEYFTENNIDTENKHTDLNPSLSASVVKSHVKLGVEKARQLHLPAEVVSIIEEHHGTSLIAYFYNKAKELDSSVSEEDFSYPGKLPTTKESAVVMLADVSEAACKSLEKPTAQRLEKFIQQLINGKIEDGQLDNSSLTFGELTKIKDSFVQILAAYYHGRIKYQNQKDPDEISSNAERDEKETSSAESLSEKTLSEAKKELERQS